MKTQNDITQEKDTTPVQRVQQETSDGGTAQLADNRESTTIQRKLQNSMSAATENTTNQIQRKNNTGLPDNLKTGIENLSGYSMDDVKVHYNSSKPAQLQAYAYAQGTDIHVAPGQEKHLPHEAWHVVQQKQGRVKPTMQFKGKMNINDDAGLEKEADVMGEKAKRGATHQNSTFESVLPVVKQNIIKSDGMNAVQRRLAVRINPQFQQVVNSNMGRADNTRPNHAAIAQSASQLTYRNLLQMYNRAIAYIRADPTGQNVLGIIENAQDRVLVRIGFDEPTVALIPGQGQPNGRISIPWNPLMFFGVWSNDRIGFVDQEGIMSPAAVLLHEFGHVAQYIINNAGYYNSRNVTDFRNRLHRNTFEITNVERPTEHHDMARFEIPFNIANNEPLRDRYSNAVASYDINYDQRPLTAGFQAEFDARIGYINNSGWVNAVTYHTQQVNAVANHRYLNQTIYNSDDLNVAMSNPDWIERSTQQYFDDFIDPLLQAGNNMFRGRFRDLIRILRDIFHPNAIPGPLKISLTLIVQPVLNWFQNNNGLTQNLDQDWQNL